MSRVWYNRLAWLLVVLVAPLFAHAQQAISGAVYDADSIIAVRNVRVLNQRTDITARTSRSGTYHIVAKDGDTLLFMHDGHRPQRVVVNMKQRELHEVVFLRKLGAVLTEVEITGDTRIRDSIARRQIYRKQIKDAEHRPRISNARTTNIGFGVEVDGPVSYGIRKLTGKQKKLEKFKAQMENDERDKYIRSRYTPSLVSHLLGVNADEAERFILDHPMPYEFAANASDLEIRAWVREQQKTTEEIRNGKRKKGDSPIRVSQ